MPDNPTYPKLVDDIFFFNISKKNRPYPNIEIKIKK